MTAYQMIFPIAGLFGGLLCGSVGMRFGGIPLAAALGITWATLIGVVASW